MARMLEDTSRTFAEYLLIPRLTRRDQRIDQIDLSAPLSSDCAGSSGRSEHDFLLAKY